MAIIECLEKGCSKEAKIRGRCKEHRAQYYARMIHQEKENNKRKWDLWEAGQVEKNKKELNFSDNFAKNMAREERLELEGEEERGLVQLIELKNGDLMVLDKRRGGW